VALLAAVVSSSIVVLNTGSAAGAGRFMPFVVRPYSCALLSTLHIGALEKGFQCRSCSLLLHVVSSLAVKRSSMEDTVTATGVSPDTLMSAPGRVVWSAPRMNLV